MTLAITRMVCCVLFACAVAACGKLEHRVKADAATESGAADIDEHRARSLALERYRSLSRGLYHRDLRSGEYAPFPVLEERDFEYAEKVAGDAWLVRAEPLAGWTVIARVGRKGDWVELLRWGFSPR